MAASLLCFSTPWGSAVNSCKIPPPTKQNKTGMMRTHARIIILNALLLPYRTSSDSNHCGCETYDFFERDGMIKISLLIVYTLIFLIFFYFGLVNSLVIWVLIEDSELVCQCFRQDSIWAVGMISLGVAENLGIILNYYYYIEYFYTALQLEQFTNWFT